MSCCEEKFRWTPKLTFDLIEAIRQRTCLWSKDDSDYLNNDTKRAAQADISILMNVPENAVRHKIRILRTIFFHVHKKHKRSKTIPKWRYYKRLLFLVDPSYAALPPSPLLVPIVENIDTQEMSKKTERADISEEDLVEPEIISTDTELNSSEDLCEVSNIQKLEESNVIAANEKFGRYVVESINNLEDFRLMKRTKARIKLLISEVLAERAMTQLAECGF